ncbi:cytochrome P450 89A2-like [Asparagus officinalis]|uniref:cytochrome P450 89A2-like n=1 Tax=Asparagus officinalis TaxID=4686 RepID=UPI00098E227B|nr:cytochrome P450 89A2-like [Asparagus officinalis]
MALAHRNVMSEILNSSRIKMYSEGRDWVLHVLIKHLETLSDGTVVAMKSFQFAMFALLILMCYGEKLDEKAIKDKEVANRNRLVYINNLNVLNFFPAISKYIFRERRMTALALRQKQKELYETVTLCLEFLNAGTDTTATTLQWIMAKLMKHQEIQNKLNEEVDRVMQKGEGIKEKYLQNMPYLKAVVLKRMRRHPPGHFVLPHAATEEIEIEGYTIPTKASINFMVAEMGLDEKVREDPLEFQPERFLTGGSGEGVDIIGSKEIKMMPFGVGRRICPGLALAKLHLEYFVANLVKKFERKMGEGEDVDLSECKEFTTVMKNPLRAG